MADITKLTLAELSDALKKRKLSSRELTLAYLNVTREKEAQIGAFLSLFPEKALQAAEEIDARRLQGESLSPLAGIPMALKDNICTKGLPTTCASRMLKDFVSPYDATVAELLADCILVGKLNMDEFAMGSSTETSALGVTRNPHKPDRVPGGSSGGSAAAVAAGEVPFSLGSDTGGSIRQPAAFCGIVGCKPTYGAVSRYGLVAFASSLDQIGPLTRNVADCAMVLDAIIKEDNRDSTSCPFPHTPFALALSGGISGMTVGVIPTLVEAHCQKEVRTSYENALAALAAEGARIVELSMPSLDYALPAYYLLSSAEASSNLARFDGIRYGHRAEKYTSLADMYCKTRSEGFGQEVKRRIMLGTFALQADHADNYYKKALQARALIRQEFRQAFALCDVIITPTTPTVAFRLGEKSDSSLSMYLDNLFTVPANLAGLPALSLPSGYAGDGLPIGMQIIAPAFGEAAMLRTAYALERALDGEKEA